MGVTLGTGVTLESFHAVGKEPDAIEVLNIRVNVPIYDYVAGRLHSLLKDSVHIHTN